MKKIIATTAAPLAVGGLGLGLGACGGTPLPGDYADAWAMLSPAMPQQGRAAAMTPGSPTSPHRLPQRHETSESGAVVTYIVHSTSNDTGVPQTATWTVDNGITGT
jgi:hypothetical protein